jgi:hypothetical protein
MFSLYSTHQLIVFCMCRHSACVKSGHQSEGLVGMGGQGPLLCVWLGCVWLGCVWLGIEMVAATLIQH